jgi:hypothetical protein
MAEHRYYPISKETWVDGASPEPQLSNQLHNKDEHGQKAEIRRAGTGFTQAGCGNERAEDAARPR